MKNVRSVKYYPVKLRRPQQSGAALIVTIMVLLSLTILALASTSSNQGQAIMVRNSQFRLEAFNTSYAEIDAQVDFINARKLSEGVPSYVQRLIDGDVNAKIGSGLTDLDKLDIYSVTSNGYMTRGVDLTYRGNCIVFGQQAGVGEEIIKCDELIIGSEAGLRETRVSSSQRQVYEYQTLNVE